MDRRRHSKHHRHSGSFIGVRVPIEYARETKCQRMHAVVKFGIRAHRQPNGSNRWVRRGERRRHTASRYRRPRGQRPSRLNGHLNISSTEHKDRNIMTGQNKCGTKHAAVNSMAHFVHPAYILHADRITFSRVVYDAPQSSHRCALATTYCTHRGLQCMRSLEAGRLKTGRIFGYGVGHCSRRQACARNVHRKFSMKGTDQEG